MLKLTKKTFCNKIKVLDDIKLKFYDDMSIKAYTEDVYIIELKNEKILVSKYLRFGIENPNNIISNIIEPQKIYFYQFFEEGKIKFKTTDEKKEKVFIYPVLNSSRLELHCESDGIYYLEIGYHINEYCFGKCKYCDRKMDNKKPKISKPEKCRYKKLDEYEIAFDILHKDRAFNFHSVDSVHCEHPFIIDVITLIRLDEKKLKKDSEYVTKMISKYGFVKSKKN